MRKVKRDVSRLLYSWARKLPGEGEKWMLGPTGKRLWMDYLDPAPGFAGRADFIHKMNIPLLFSVGRADCREAALSPMRVLWQADGSRFFHESSGLSFEERKLITWEDQALSLQTWENRGEKPLTLTLLLPEGAALGKPFSFPCALHGVTPVMLVKSGEAWPGGCLTLAPGERKSVFVAAAVGLPGEEEAMSDGLDALLSRPAPEQLMAEKAEEYLRWFDGVPDFECDDEKMTVCWYYRFYILRKNMSEPGLGRLPGLCFYEGRSHRMAKTPYQAQGWEFSRLIPLSTPLQVTDARWLRRGAAAQSALEALTHCLDENGVFAVASVDACQKEYANYAGWALYLFYTVHGGEDFVRRVLPAFKTDAKNVYERTRRGDSLQIERTHQLTGKEYQPSYWFFGKDCFPKTVKPAQEGYTPLKRVDRSVYTYLNFTGLSRLCRLVGDGDGDYFALEAEKMARDILSKMWDGPSRCFYDLHHETDEKAFVKNIVALYPLWADITGEEHLALFDYLLSGQYFALGSGFASTAADCPVFSPNGGWRGDYIKGPHGCMWNGPSWPYTTGIALDALAKQSKKHGHRYDAAFEKYLAEYTQEHFLEGDIHRPWLVEFYDSRTGAPLSEEPDYSHSFYIDLIVRHLAGIEPEEKGVRFQPLRTGRAYFSLRGLRVQGHEIDVYYQQKASSAYPGLDAGYTVYVDGRERRLGLDAENIPLF